MKKIVLVVLVAALVSGCGIFRKKCDCPKFIKQADSFAPRGPLTAKVGRGG